MRVALGIGLAAVLTATSALATDRDVSELFDPAVINRNICGRDGMAALDLALAQLANAPTDQADRHRPRLWPGLGTFTFKIATSSPEAQAYFDQGLRLTYGFNHGEAIRAFRAAQEIDPKCAICAWGELQNLGPNINGPMHKEDNPQALAAMRQAMRLLTPATPPKERALIEALQMRYVPHFGQKRDKQDKAYADAMAKAYQAFPNDPDVAIAFIEAAMVASPYPWFAKDTNAPSGRIAEAIAATERVLAADPHHPGAIHYYIHLAEQPMPEKAEPYADQLAGLTPGIGHMVHMPSHIYFRLGRYKDSLNANLTAVAVDEKLIAAVPETSQGYRYGLYPHNIHMAMASASMAGDGKNALAMATKMLDALGPLTVRNDYYVAATFAPILRFEAPEVTLARPKPDDKMLFSVGLWHYARGSAFAWQNDLTRARAEVDAIAKMRADAPKKGKKTAANSSVLELAETVLRARIDIAAGDMDAAKRHLESAVAIQDKDTLYRGDPPPWDAPLRQSLGIFLLHTGHPAEALPLLRQALIDMPNSAWALYALQEASAQTGDMGAAEQYAKLFAKAWLGVGTPDLGRI